MLFDDEVSAFLKEHFLCVLTDAPWSKVSQRNAPTWEEVESWKSAARNSEIVFVVTADKKDRRGIVYRDYKEPGPFLELLRDLAREDGILPMPEADRDRMVAVNRTRARLTTLRRILNDQPDQHRSRADLKTFDAFAGKFSDRDLCPGDARAFRARLEANAAPERERLARYVDGMIGLAAGLDARNDVVVRPIATARAKPSADFADVTGLELAAKLLQRRLLQLAEEQDKAADVEARLEKLRGGKGGGP